MSEPKFPITKAELLAREARLDAEARDIDRLGWVVSAEKYAQMKEDKRRGLLSPGVFAKFKCESKGQRRRRRRRERLGRKL